MPDRPLRHHGTDNLRRMLAQHPPGGGLCPVCSSHRRRVAAPCPLRTLAEQELARRQAGEPR